MEISFCFIVDKGQHYDSNLAAVYNSIIKNIWSLNSTFLCGRSCSCIKIEKSYPKSRPHFEGNAFYSFPFERKGSMRFENVLVN